MVTAKPERGVLVATGSSAGGIEALSTVLGMLPAGFRAAVVVAQHLDPGVPSNLPAILAKHSALPVVTVNGSTKLRAGTVYVIPSDRHVQITNDSVDVRSDVELGRPKPSIDFLFASAAEAYGERLIAVVLTGLGSDGSAGARAVKRNGGTVIIEDPMTASFPSMPASLEPGMVDVIAPLDQIGPELVRLVDEAFDFADDPRLDELLERIRSSSGIDFSLYKTATIKRRLARQMSLHGNRTYAEYLAALAADPAEFDRLVQSFLIKVTHFFRDPELFADLRDRIVPELIAEAHTRGSRELRVWSAGCATGEEAYSIAILIVEALRDVPDDFSVRIFATDIDEGAITFARRGVYPADAVADIDPELVARYFTRVESGWEVTKNIRALTVFGQHDLAQRAPFPRIDLALCRNVLIYFSKELQTRTLQIFAFSLRNGGYLALGKSETTNPLAQYFAVVNPALRIFRRHGDRGTIPSAQPQKQPIKLRDADRGRQPFPALVSAPRDTRPTINEKLGAFLNNSIVGVIFVDRHYDIISINASARAMFSLHGVAVGEDLVHMVPAATSAKVRSMLDGALRNQQPTAGGEEIEVVLDAANSTARYFTLSCYPEVTGGNQVTGAVILAVDVTELAEARRASEAAVTAQNIEIQRLRASEAHARERQRSLVEANVQLAQVNSDLRAQNDALVISAEEAEAATEEIETLNEEMQATNEELETLNEEFQATIEELNTTNDEHEARSRELEDQALVRASELAAAQQAAAALNAIIDDAPTALAVVDAGGTVVASNRAFRAIVDGAGERSVQIDDDTGATIPLGVVLRRAGDGHAFAFRYRSIAADQALSLYDGSVRPLADGDRAYGIIELARTAG